jgi:Fe-S cluster biogenesis protein NfuA
VFIQIEETPNPATLKFLPGHIVMEEGTAEFRSKEEAVVSSLASHLFSIHGITNVFFGADFLAISKSDEAEWALLKPSVLTCITDHFIQNSPLFQGDVWTSSSQENDDPIVMQIKDILDDRVRPAVAMDGGDIIFDRFEEGVLYLRLQGACSGCPSSSATLKTGIENMMRHYVPEVIEVRAINT